MKILVIAPHPDDESIGCGGAVALHLQRGDEVSVVFLTSGELGLKQFPREKVWKIREGEARAACKVLGVGEPQFLRMPDWTFGDDIASAAARVAPLLQQTAPDLIYVPHPNEWHPDHKASLPVLRVALQRSGQVKPQLRGYEVWTPIDVYQHVEDVTGVMSKKLRALRQHVSQLKEWEYVRAIKGLNEYRGAMAGRCRYAEVFQELSPIV